MSKAAHATDDGSLARSAGGALGRGILLLLLAVGIGVVLLAGTDQTAPADRLVAAAADEGTSDGGGGEPRGTGTSTSTSTVPQAPPTVPTRPARDVKVLVANGTDVQGAGRNVTEVLRPPGYNLLSPVDATGAKVDATSVYFAPEYAPEAGAIAQALEVPPAAVKPLPAEAPVRALNDANVLVVVGSELAARTAAPTTTTAGPAATTTTARAGATTTTR
ncbi:MAG: hypothetical protein AVDCRST_MAG50-2658 [uncultured Acidimicrobiales bacterium]|uniref:LytR/CpsA/Psr regulator C-terminal domain-containing protein n=1 Tax=uncultured Acidimicrobiales bacterium TaxID=310071 RepID=A0A6J4IMW1_9ACTN|nr:MAG: hypothetical protein AVDCRST_MAG50-2658 [uncultured Acidimicrobiales bacterium]